MNLRDWDRSFTTHPSRPVPARCWSTPARPGSLSACGTGKQSPAGSLRRSQFEAALKPVAQSTERFNRLWYDSWLDAAGLWWDRLGFGGTGGTPVPRNNSAATDGLLPALALR